MIFTSNLGINTDPTTTNKHGNYVDKSRSTVSQK